MIKKTTILFLAIALVFSGCAKNQKESSNSIEFENSENEEIMDSAENPEVEEIQDAIIDTIEETKKDENLEEEIKVVNSVHENDTVTENNIEYESIFVIPKDENESRNKDIKIICNYNSFTLTWDNDKYDYFKLYASSTEDGKYNLVKSLHKEIKEDSSLLPYSVSLTEFEPGTKVYIRISAVEVIDGEVIENAFGDTILYESKSVNDFNNAELQLHLIKKFPIIGTSDMAIGFRFYDRYIIEENENEIIITSNLKGEYIDIFNKAIETEYKEELVDNIKSIYEYVYYIKGKKVIGVIENELTITINNLEDIDIDFK